MLDVGDLIKVNWNFWGYGILLRKNCGRYWIIYFFDRKKITHFGEDDIVKIC